MGNKFGLKSLRVTLTLAIISLFTIRAESQVLTCTQACYFDKTIDAVEAMAIYLATVEYLTATLAACEAASAGLATPACLSAYTAGITLATSAAGIYLGVITTKLYICLAQCPSDTPIGDGDSGGCNECFCDPAYCDYGNCYECYCDITFCGGGGGCYECYCDPFYCDFGNEDDFFNFMLEWLVDPNDIVWADSDGWIGKDGKYHAWD